RRTAAQHAHDLAGEPRRIDQIFAVQFVVYFQHLPAQRPVDLPLHLGETAEHALLALEAASVRAAEGALAGELDARAFGMVGGDASRVDLAASRTERHERRPSSAILL